VIFGIGTDVVSVERVEQIYARFGEHFAQRLLLDEEQRLFAMAKRPVRFLAMRFAAKEAIAKALGAPTGMGWHDAEIVTDDAGAPSFLIKGSVQARAEELGVRVVHVSMSHDAGIASAFVVLED
jgi:holo-[acyl-carrier protein] synthase